MTGRERVIAALNRRQPDRVPIFELMIDRRVIDALIPGGSYADFCETFEIDMVLTPTPSSLYDKALVDERDGVRYVRTEWGELRADTGDLVAMPTGDFPIRTMADLKRYTPPDPLAPRRYESLEALLRRFRGRKAVGMHLHEAMSYPTYLMGMARLFEAMYTDSDLVHALVELSAEHQATMARRACALGVDYIVLGDDYCDAHGSLMSPAHFETFFLPGFRKVVQAAKDGGAYVVKHSDGQVLPLLEMMIDAGIDAIHPCDPAAGLTVAEMKRQYGDRVCVMGNVDTGAPLCQWPVDQLIERVRRLLSEAMRAPGTGWIISSANTIHKDVRPENYRAMIQTVCEVGWYG